MIRFREPLTADIRDFLNNSALTAFSYLDLGCTRGRNVAGYNTDRFRIELGSEEATFEKAKRALRDWRGFSTDWARICWPYKKIVPGAVVAVLAHHYGFYSVNVYSAIMTRGEAVIAVSESIRTHVLANYSGTSPARLTVIHRGVDEARYPTGFKPADEWLRTWENAHPALDGKIPLLMPGRLTRWKGQEDFLRLVKRLLARGLPVHGLVAGEPHAKKAGFLEELKTLASHLEISGHVTFLGHRSDLREIMAISALVYSLSRDPEAFGRVSLEAMSLGKPVIGYGHGGVAEQLKVIFPQGLVTPGDEDAAFLRSVEILENGGGPSSIGPFTLRRMLESTVDVYNRLLGSPR